ncbi:hypothetical protein CVT24_000463 [Panaeolus cyanescens]|uniref:Uncharacterized protein n=1 Tax=Panaeolus cyanescens TaxID=181874 RepID=A0A409VAD5_9AGAR|nr:hypothetical protein CVT24_000463 [Panaeolus cyanescens]
MPSIPGISVESHMHHQNTASDQEEDPARIAAAILIQRLWRGRTNKAKDEYLRPEVRWEDATKRAMLSADRQHAFEGRNSPRARWRRAVHFAIMLRDRDTMLKNAGIDLETVDKHLETQHWLELIDGYASGAYPSMFSAQFAPPESIDMVLIWYHKRWQEDDTRDNFFRWLDQGDGKDLSLDECPREQLEKERIAYLSAEQRLNYLVVIDEQGKLRWAKNNQPVDTTAGAWKDAGEGQGIVPENMTATRRPRFPARRASSSSLESQLQANAATHYAGGSVKPGHRWRGKFTLRGAFEKLLRKTVQRNTWIYVSHFHKFIEVLQQRGVDTSKVRISKAEAALWGIEHLAKIKKSQERIVSSSKHTLKKAPDRISRAFHNISNRAQ